MTDVLMKRGNLETDTREDANVRMKAEIGGDASTGRGTPKIASERPETGKRQ